ncbi:hypothetical protein SAMN02745225_00193 [Ferrithrix thermotolerans DSM 19514]|uniref:Uncharacterized protein n=1 Tax=Ferrithrix thermotolerans DSM 19514 TaxID=1121881 RepID=A0A1M4SBV7_9ACTN|nr:hypothetical protein SAMN02745225_00193 [Ferrithrix thermotolerans DSM 19514]
MGCEILQRFSHRLGKGDRRELIYQFIDIQKAEFLVSVLDRVCQVLHSIYYPMDNKGCQVHEAVCRACETLKERVLEASRS